MRRFVLLGVLACDACLDPVAYACESDVQCARGGVVGTCEEQGYCSFPDDTCPSNRRFAELAPATIAGQCVEEGGSTGTVPPPTSTSIDPSTTTSISTSTSATSSMPTTDADGSSSTTLPITSGPDPSSSSTGEPELPDPIGWWSMDELEGDVASDQGTGGFPGALEGGPTFVPGHIDNAVLLDGVDDNVHIGDHAAHDIEEFTLAAWIWIAAAPTLPRANLIGKGFSYRLRLEGTTTRPGIAFHDEDADQANDTGSLLCTGDLLSTEVWYHVATTYGLEDRTVRLFVDGVEVCALTTTGGDGRVQTDGTANLRIGRSSDGSAFNGMIDDVRLYDRALDEDDILELASM